jgi:hypothetical protein
MTTEHRRSRVLLGSGIVTLAMLASACSGGGSDSTASTPILTVPETAAVTTESAPTTTIRPEAAAALAAAVASLGTKYSFRSDITTEAGDQVVVVGTRVDDSSMFSIEAGGATIDVVVVAGAVWIRQDGSDEWLPSVDAPTADPLQPLAAPLLLSWNNDDPTRLDATYAPGPLGLGGTENIDVQIVPTADTLTFESNSGTTHLLTTLHPAPDAAPIQPPVG